MMAKVTRFWARLEFPGRDLGYQVCVCERLEAEIRRGFSKEAAGANGGIQDVYEKGKFMGLKIVETVPVDGKGRVKANVLDSSSVDGVEKTYTVHCRYLIGCDGSRTVVRGAA